MSGTKGQKYERLFESDEEAPPHEQILMSHDSNKWNQILNLDDFFTRIYNYHRNNGFWCMFVNELLQLLQFIFVVIFVVFLTCCIDYEKLGTTDPSISDAIDWTGLYRIHGFIALLVIIAAFYWCWRCFKFIWNTTKYGEIKQFYRNVLKIPENDISNLDWLEVQCKIIESQKEVQLCLHKESLSELDISNRILRMDNYKIAMINKNVLPYSFNFPILGNRVFLSKVLMGNLELILFSGPWAPFKNSWKLDERYKRRESRELLADQLSKNISYIALINFLLMPFMFIWQFIFLLVHYAELVKREPGFLGVRMWSLYARYFLRHYNELNHEFDSRLKRAYIPANKYLNLFTSPMLVIIAKNVGFFAGAILLVLVILTLINEELLFADNVPLAITVLGITVSVCRAVIPDANQVFCPDVLMKEVLQHTHYQPDSWINAAHLPHARQQFSQMFVLKGVYLAEELLSPLLTPFILYFNVRLKALEFVDFLRNYTVNIVGVGDVCSFSQMDIKRHGNPDWMSFGMTSGMQGEQANHGKTELSLINFSIRNPAWKPQENEAMYISTIKALAKQDGEEASQSMMASMAQSMRGSLIQQSPTPMLASMNVPHFSPPEPAVSSSTLTEEPETSHHTDITNQPPAMSSPHHSTARQDPLLADQEEVTGPSSDEEGGGRYSPLQDQEEMLPPQDMQTNIGQKRYIFDEQYTQIEQSYRETRQPIMMSESLPAATGLTTDIGTRSQQPMFRSVDISARNFPPASGLSRPPASGMGQSGMSMSALSQSRMINQLSHSQLINSSNFMSMSTLDASMFISASPQLEHSQWAATSSLSQGCVKSMDVSWPNAKKEYRDLVKSSDLNSSALYLHSLHTRLKMQQERPEDMMTRSLYSQMDQQRRQDHMTKSYPSSSNTGI